MFALLLCLGAATTLAGVVLLGAGMPIIGRPYDPSVITPGAVAVVGGLILLGLGFTVRVLGRIERMLAAQPVPQAAHAATVVAAHAAAEPRVAPSVGLPPPLPALPVAVPEAQPAVAAAPPPAAVTETAQQRLQEKFPALVTVDSAVLMEETEVALLPKAPSRVDAGADINGAAVSAKPRPATPPARAAVPRRDSTIRTVARPDRTRSLDAVWPKRPTPLRASPPLPPPSMSEPAEPALPSETSAPPPPAQIRETAAPAQANGAAVATAVPISILKSGIVDGMAYTLYSDGSIEAQLPAGTLRFSSITELRNHVEQNS
jgi:hypothetical protein